MPPSLSIPFIDAGMFSDSCALQINHVKLVRLRCWTLQQEGVMAERKKRSKAQLHVTKKDYNGASCNVCKMIISGKGWR